MKETISTFDSGQQMLIVIINIPLWWLRKNIHLESLISQRDSKNQSEF